MDAPEASKTTNKTLDSTAGEDIVPDDKPIDHVDINKAHDITALPKNYIESKTTVKRANITSAPPDMSKDGSLTAPNNEVEDITTASGLMSTGKSETDSIIVAYPDFPHPASRMHNTDFMHRRQLKN